MSNVAKFLDRLTKVRETGPGRWTAICPAHADKSPSLSVRDNSGKILVHCFAGCSAVDVLQAVGLEMSDLFDPPREHHIASSHARIPANDILVVIDHELTVAMLVLFDVISRRTVNEGQVQRLCKAAQRIAAARDMANPEKVQRNAA